MPTDGLLVNFFYAHALGHVVEALHYAVGHRAADPDRDVAVVLNAAAPTELARWCPGVSEVHPVRHPLLDACPDSATRVARLPREWAWVCDDFRRHQPLQLELFAGLRDYYAATDAHLHASRGRTVVGDPSAGYLPHQPLRLALPETARVAASRRLDDRPYLALLPAGSAEGWLYPSASSWLRVLDALTEAMPDLGVVLVGRSPVGERTATSVAAADRERLLAHRSAPVDAFDLDLADQLALVEASAVFCSPHSGFGMGALAVGTPWLALSGGRWFEYFVNHVPFRSIVPDPDRWPSFAQFDTVPVTTDDDGSDRTPSMTGARITEDLPRLVAAAEELVGGRVSYEQCLTDHVAALVAAHHGDPSPIWSIDGIHRAYLPPGLRAQPSS